MQDTQYLILFSQAEIMKCGRCESTLQRAATLGKALCTVAATRNKIMLYLTYMICVYERTLGDCPFAEVFSAFGHPCLIFVWEVIGLEIFVLNLTPISEPDILL